MILPLTLNSRTHTYQQVISKVVASPIPEILFDPSLHVFPHEHGRMASCAQLTQRNTFYPWSAWDLGGASDRQQINNRPLGLIPLRSSTQHLIPYSQRLSPRTVTYFIPTGQAAIVVPQNTSLWSPSRIISVAIRTFGPMRSRFLLQEL